MREAQAHPGHRVPLDPRALQDHKDLKEIREAQAHPGHRGLLEARVPQGHKDLREIRGIPAQPDHRGPLVVNRLKENSRASSL